MKQTILSILILILMTGCSHSPQDRATNMIKGQLTVAVPGYMPDQFSNLDSNYSFVAREPIYKELTKRIDSIDMLFKWDMSRHYLNDAEKDQKAEHQLILQRNKFQDAYIPRFIGWKMEHMFRMTDLTGNVITQHQSYCFDIPLTKIVNSDSL